MGFGVWTYDVDEEPPDVPSGVLWPVSYRPMTGERGEKERGKLMCVQHTHCSAMRSSSRREDCRRFPKLTVRSSHSSYLFTPVRELALRTRTGDSLLLGLSWRLRYLAASL